LAGLLTWTAHVVGNDVPVKLNVAPLTRQPGVEVEKTYAFWPDPPVAERSNDVFAGIAALGASTVGVD
jgi:hypothetical protein